MLVKSRNGVQNQNGVQNRNFSQNKNFEMFEPFRDFLVNNFANEFPILTKNLSSQSIN